MTIQNTSIEHDTSDGLDLGSDRMLVVQAGVTILSGQIGVLTGTDNHDGSLSVSGDSSIYNYGNILSTNDGSTDEGLYGEGLYAVAAAHILNGASGSIAGYDALFADQLNGEIVNEGSINGVHAGINLESTGNALLNNSGTISADTYGIFLDNLEQAPDRIVNTGLLQGGSYAFFADGDGDETIRNAGRIVGDVQLGNGSNTFNGHGGIVDGTIMGGAGSDTITAGNDGETMIGNGGYDYLHAGGGADVFVLNSANTRDRDRIYDFDVAHDKVELDHHAFTTLTADSAPVFAIGTKATSTSDHLFYNSSTGYLFYDRDGSASHYAAVAIAHLDPGLHLTAADFTVI